MDREKWHFALASKRKIVTSLSCQRLTKELYLSDRTFNEYKLVTPTSFTSLAAALYAVSGMLNMSVEPGSSYVYRSMADGCAEMVFHYKGLFNPIAADDSITLAVQLFFAACAVQTL